MVVHRDGKTQFLPSEKTLMVCWRTEVSEQKILIHHTSVVIETGLKRTEWIQSRKTSQRWWYFLKYSLKAYLVEGTRR